MRETTILTHTIKSRAVELGFDAVGVAPAGKLDAAFLHDWFSKNYHGTMAWMERTADKRIDPDKYLPGVKSIIAVAVNYFTDDPPRPAETGQVSRYAVGRDYHLVMREMLQPLVSYISEMIPGAALRTAVDDAPVMDKIWAARAGIGWIGRHANLITRERGSYVFLGEIFTTAGLTYDSPIPDYCGTCVRCVEACPTDAILEGKVIDSTRCISYRTIEFRGEYPSSWKGKNRDWIFGCDICQEVCPWNKFARNSALGAFSPREGVRFPLLDDLQNLTRADFREQFGDSPIKRTKWEGLQRNAREVRSYSACVSEYGKK